MKITFVTRYSLILTLFFISCAVTGCDSFLKGEDRMPSVDQVTASEWNLLIRRNILFGHQSVGANIVSGVQSLAKRAGVDLPVIESRKATVLSGITHFVVGRNEEPITKLSDFSEVMEQLKGKSPDIALMKICYIDINSRSDTKKLSADYIAMIDRLSSKFPHTKFIAVTAPLTTLQTGPKAWLKRLAGKAPSGYGENYRRMEFNNILRSKFKNEGQLFDLAKFESEGVNKYQYNGQLVEAMNPVMASDGGHLNQLGQEYIAAKLIKHVVSLPRNENTHH